MPQNRQGGIGKVGGLLSARNVPEHLAYRVLGGALGGISTRTSLCEATEAFVRIVTQLQLGKPRAYAIAQRFAIYALAF
jgi:hypothetical protein